jgi:hypothetical protein
MRAGITDIKESIVKDNSKTKRKAISTVGFGILYVLH